MIRSGARFPGKRSGNKACDVTYDMALEGLAGLAGRAVGYRDAAGKCAFLETLQDSTISVRFCISSQVRVASLAAPIVDGLTHSVLRDNPHRRHPAACGETTRHSSIETHPSSS